MYIQYVPFTKKNKNIHKYSVKFVKTQQTLKSILLIWHVFRNLSTFYNLLFSIIMPPVSLSLYIQSSSIFAYETEGKFYIVPRAGSELSPMKSISPKALLLRNSS